MQGPTKMVVILKEKTGSDPGRENYWSWLATGKSKRSY